MPAVMGTKLRAIWLRFLLAVFEVWCSPTCSQVQAELFWSQSTILFGEWWIKLLFWVGFCFDEQWEQKKKNTFNGLDKSKKNKQIKKGMCGAARSPVSIEQQGHPKVF